MFRPGPLTNIACSKLGIGKTLGEAADSVEIIEAETVEPAAPLIVLPGMLDRVTNGVVGHSTMQEEVDAATTTLFKHAPVVKYTLSDCLVHHGGVEYRGGFVAKTGAVKDRFRSGRAEPVDAACYCMSLVSHTYFGHWLTDACPTALLASHPGEVILDERPDWPDTAIYARAFGIKTQPCSPKRVSRLTLYSDFAQGMSKRNRYKELRLRLRGAEEISENHPDRPVYFRRGSTGAARLIAREDELCEYLAKEGFDIIDLSGESFWDRYRALAKASVLVTMDSSHVNHAYFAMQEGRSIISLSPADRFAMRERGVAAAFGFGYGSVVVRPSPDGYIVDPEEILETVELALRRQGLASPAIPGILSGDALPTASCGFTGL